MEATKELVKLGLGVSLLAPWVSHEEFEDGSLRAVPLGRRKLERHWGIIHWRGKRLGLPEETFIGLCREVTATLATTTAGTGAVAGRPSLPQAALLAKLL